MAADTKKNDSADILDDMAEAHEEQPGEKVQPPKDGEPAKDEDGETEHTPREDD